MSLWYHKRMDIFEDGLELGDLTVRFQDIQQVTQYKVGNSQQIFGTLSQAIEANLKITANKHFGDHFIRLSHTTGDGDRVWDLPKLAEFIATNRNEIQRFYQEFDVWASHQMENKP